MSACVGCGTALAADAKFCAVCGRPAAAMAGAASAQVPPMPPPIAPALPQMPQMMRAAGASGGQSRQVAMAGSPAEVFARALQAIGANGGEIQWQQAPQAAKFLLTRKSFWSTAGIAIKYDGDLQVSATAPGQANARVALKLQWNSAVPLMLMQAGAVVIAAMFNYYFAAFALLFLVASLAITAWNASSGIPDKALNDIMRALQGGAPMPSAQPASAYTPPPAPPPAPVPAPAPVAGGDTASIVEQIKQLASLRDAGALTPDEFEAKKKDLLSRI